MQDEKMNVGPGIYRHYKGALYEVLCVARFVDLDSKSLFVVYKPGCGSAVAWIRSLDEFIEDVSYQGKMVSRFSRYADRLEL